MLKNTMSRLTVRLAALLLVICQYNCASQTDFFTAIERGNLTKVQQVLDQGVPVNEIRSKAGDTPLMAAISSKQIGSAQLLLDAGADINQIGSGAITLNPLMKAALLTDRTFTVVKPVSAASFPKTNVMYTDVLRFLIKRDADLNYKVPSSGLTFFGFKPGVGITPVMFAAQIGKKDIARLFVQNFALLPTEQEMFQAKMSEDAKKMIHSLRREAEVGGLE